jgi:hypothetical protein
MGQPKAVDLITLPDGFVAPADDHSTVIDRVGTIAEEVSAKLKQKTRVVTLRK